MRDVSLTLVLIVLTFIGVLLLLFGVQLHLMASTVTVPLGPAKVNITGVRAGDRNEFTMTLHRSGTPLDLTGLTLTAQARKKAADPDPPAITAVIEITDAAAGELGIRWPGAEVGIALAGSETWAGVWDLQAATGDSVEPLTLVAGTFGAVMDITRP